MRAGDDEGSLARKEALAEGARHARAWQLELERADGLDVVLANRVADHDELEVLADVVRAPSRQATDPRVLERGAHRRIERHIGPADVVSCVAEQLGELSHAGACDSDQMNAHLVLNHRSS